MKHFISKITLNNLNLFFALRIKIHKNHNSDVENQKPYKSV